MDIAIIGIAVRMPEANTLWDFEGNLAAGKDSVREISDKRRKRTGLSLTNDYQLLGYLDDIDLFDYSFFGISRSEAKNMSPQQRILMEIAYEVFENAGYDHEYFNSSKTAVYIGDTQLQYYELAREIEPTLYTGNMNSIMAARLARFFNLRQKALMVDTTCSSSLVALHLACADLASRECDYALVGGVSLNLFPHRKTGSDLLGILSPGGKARAFSAEADGTSPGEAGVCMLLKPLDKALADKDHIHAVIKGSAVNQDANLSGSLTAPSSIAQAEVIKEAWRRAQIDPENVGYIEAHGTGTRLGDPIEIDGIGQAFGPFTDKKNFCAISAVKSNIGHTDCVAGLAGLVKAVLSLKQQKLFPTLHFREPNPFIDFNNSPVYVNDMLRPWQVPEEGVARIAGVSSFGLTGTNCHVVVSEAPVCCLNNDAKEDAGPYPVMLSAFTQASLGANINALLDYIKREPAVLLRDISYTMATGRKHYKYRLVVWASSIEELELALRSSGGQLPADSQPQGYKKNVLVFSDWHEYLDLARTYCQHPVFGKYYRLCEELAAGGIQNRHLGQFAFQYSLYKLLEHAGVRIDIMVGDKLGKIVIAAITAAMPLAEAIEAAGKFISSPEPVFDGRTKALLDKFGTEKVLFIEMGPLGDITRQISALLTETDVARKAIELTPVNGGSLLSCLARLFLLHVEFNMTKAWPEHTGKRIELPTYQFARERCWLEEDYNFDKVKEWCYTFKWTEEALSSEHVRIPYRSLLLVAPVNNSLADALEEQITSWQGSCYRVHLSDTFRRIDDRNYEVRAENETDCISAVTNLKGIGTPWDGVVFIASSGAQEGMTSAHAESGMAGIFARFTILKACNELLATKGGAVISITVNACKVLPAERPDPFQSMHAGMLRGLQAEYPSLRIHSIDFNSPGRNNIGHLIKELENDGHGINYCAYRDNRRYVATLGRQKELIPEKEEMEWFPENGVYLVTGGATGIGLAISHSILRRRNSTFIVLGRTALPIKKEWKATLADNNADSMVRERVKALINLEKTGATTEYHAVDVGDPAALRTVIEGIKKRYERMDGILHAAGLVVENIPFEQQTLSFCQQALAAKVQGTIWLDELMQELEPRFFVLFSSLNAWVPKKYSTAYTMANTFEDAYAVYRSAQSRTRYLSVNWPGWDLAGKETHREDTGAPAKELRAIKPDDGISAFYYAMQLNSANVAIVPLDPYVFAANPYFRIEGQALHQPVAAAVIPQNLSPTEKKLLTIWREVLKSNSIGIEDDFFEAGGHSLIGIQIVNRIEKELAITIEFEIFFDYYTVKTLADHLDELLSDTTEENVYKQIQPVEEQEYYNVSFAQKRLWILDLLIEGNVYNIPITYVLNGRLNITALEAAFDTLIRRHENLRTVLLDIDGLPKQRVLDADTSAFRIKFEDLSKADNRYEMADRLVASVVDIKFDLFKGPVILAQLIQLEADKFIFSFTLHHIISDGWSSEIIIRELIQAYNAFNRQIPAALPPLSIQYKDYTSWQQQQAKTQLFQEHRHYWLQRFAGPIPVLDLPTDKPRPAIQTFRGKTIFFNYDAELQQKLRELGIQQDATSFMVLFSVINILLYRYAGQKDIIVGAAVTERGHYDLENQIGFYVNTLPLRTPVDPGDNIITLLGKVKKIIADANKHKDFPLELLIEDLNLARDSGRSPLFDVMAIYQHTGSSVSELKMDDIEVDDYPLDTEISRFDMTFDFYESDNGILLKLVFNSALYTTHFAERMGRHLQQILVSCLNNPSQVIDGLSVADTIEKEEILQAAHSVGRMALAYDLHDTLVARWEKAVLAYGERPALWFGEQEWSYQALNAKINRLAHNLRESYEITAGDRVAFLLDKSAGTVISILAILKAGAAYLPLDPAHPAERIQYILHDALPKAVIVQSDYLSKLEDYEGGVFVVDLELDGLKPVDHDPERINSAMDAACCIYTSGTTGLPKGSVIEHHSLVNLTEGLTDLLSLDSDHSIRMAVIAPVVFDPFGKQLFLALLNGHSLYIVPDAVKKSVSGLWDYYIRHQIELTDGTPSFLQLLLNFFPAELPPVRYWLIGGEILPVKLARSLQEQYGSMKEGLILINEYGLTECAVDNCCYKVDFDRLPDSGAMPIGRPLRKSEIFLLDEKSRPVPEGTAGEICIAGAGVGRGYLNRQELTREKFIEAEALQGLLVFKTGDMGRRLADGNLICLGRKDRQVKIRANRIELGEIEQVLRRNPQVNEVYVTDRKDGQGETYLVAYILTRQALAQQELKGFLERYLPDYMIPAYFVYLESFPQTLNGKIDKAALPDPSSLNINHQAYIAPSNETEKKLSEIWKEVLSKEQISIKDSFFDIGGHSLKAVQVVFRLQKEFKADISVTAIFRNPTIERLAKEIEKVMHVNSMLEEQGRADMEEVIL